MTTWRVVLTAARTASVVAVIAALVRGGRGCQPLRAAPLDAPHRLITVVVPARDEARRIGPLLQTLHEMLVAGAIHEAIVVDDGSTDATAQTCHDAGVCVVTPREVPSGWAGKPWAIERGVAAATGEWIVTLDADVRPSRLLPQAAVERCVVDGIDLLTLAPSVECPTAGAAWVHPSLLTTLVYRFGRPGVAAPAHRTLANGQCMVFRRSWFVDDGGFGEARSASEEDVAFARAAARRGAHVAFLAAADLLTVRAYEDLADALRGWGRSIGLTSVTPPLRRLIDVTVLALVMPLPLVRLALRRADGIDLVALAIRCGTVAGVVSTYPGSDSARRAAHFLSPLADPLTWLVVAGGSIGRRRTWRGRTV